jgi:predicted nucleotide-binding protein
MSELAEILYDGADRLENAAKKAMPFTEPLQRVREAANVVGRAWSGGWLGYHSRVYYADLQPVPAGAHFSTEWGFDTHFVTHPTVGEWCEYTFDAVRDHILAMAKVTSLEAAEKEAKQIAASFQESREATLSTISLALEQKEDAFLQRLESQVEQLRISSKLELARALTPRGQFLSRDMIAVTKGIQTPPHMSMIAEVGAILNIVECCDKLTKLARRGGSHLNAREREKGRRQVVGMNVFIGHGRSIVWRDLKDFVQDRLGLPWDEFNRVPVAGITNITRLSQMLDDAAIAFLVLTGEDEQADAKVHPRLNVVHEAGLFQGRLGFTKAIVLLEDGCGEFSNIEGLGQIRFPKGNIKAVFEEIRRVLEREGLVDV